jgi:general secretion pathway protein C
MNMNTLIELITIKLYKTTTFQGLSLIFCGLILWQITSLFTLFPGLNKSVNIKQIEPDSNQTQSISKHQAGLKNMLFGDYIPVSLDAENVRQSTLNLIIVGILYTAKDHDSQVILQESNGQEHFFSVGDKLPGGAVIKRITADGVLIRKNGELERLSLPKDELQFEPPAKPLVAE